MIQPLLEKRGVNLVGIGLEELGAEEFVGSGFLVGEIYVDEKKQCYQDLGFKRQAVLVSCELCNTLDLLLFEGFHG